MKNFSLYMAVVFLMAMPHAGWALPFNKLLIIPDGISEFTPPGWKEPVVVMKAWRDNPNAHGFFDITFLFGDMTPRRITGDEKSINWDDDDNLHRLDVIGVHDGMGVSGTNVNTWHNGSTTTWDYKLLFKKNQTFLVEAGRVAPLIYDKDKKMNFVLYKLTSNDGDEPIPDTRYFFRRIKTFKSRQDFIAADEAMDAEMQQILEFAK